MKLTLIEGWRKAARLASVQLAALVAIVAGIITANPALALGLIGFLPTGPMRVLVAVGVAIVVFVIPTATRLIRKDASDG
jgi:hypothetical protein